MKPSNSCAALAAILAFSASAPAAASDSRAMEGPAAIQSPTLGPTTNTNLAPGLNTGGMNANTGIDTRTGIPNVADPAGNMAAPQGQALSAQGQAPTAQSQAIDPARAGAIPVQNRGAVPTNPSNTAPLEKEQARPEAVAPSVEKAVERSGTKQIKATMDQIQKHDAEAQGGAQATGNSAAELGKFFDAQHVYDAKVDGPQGAGSGGGTMRQLGAKDRVIENVRIANERSTPPADVPGLYLAGLAVAREAAAKGGLPKAVAEKVAQKIVEFAAQKAKTSLPELANAAYQAAATGEAGRRAVERAVGPRAALPGGMDAQAAKPSAFDQWQELLGSNGRPLISNAAPLKNDVWRVQQEAVKAAAQKTWAPSVSFRENADGTYLAVLPSASVSRLPDFAGALPLGSAAVKELESDLAAYSREPTAANGFRVVRRRAGLSAAVSFWMKATVMSLWQRVWEGVLNLFGRGPAQALVRLSRAPSQAEAAAAQGAAVGFADFAALESPYLDVQRLIARPALTVGQARSALAQGAALADAAKAVTRDGAGAQAISGLLARLNRQTKGLADTEALASASLELLRGDGGLSYWAERIRGSAYERIDRAAAGQTKNQVYADLSNGSAPMVRVYLNQTDTKLASGLADRGFRIESSGRSAIAVFDHESGIDGDAALSDAIALVKNGGTAQSEASADTQQVSRVVSSFLKHSGKDRLADIERTDPGFARFSPAEIVRSGARAFWVERSRGRLDGKASDLYLVRDLQTRRPLFAQAFPLTAH